LATLKIFRNHVEALRPVADTIGAFGEVDRRR
jgi:hypothetical protein